MASTTTSPAKIITVFGATGAQGGSVVTALLNDGTFAVRAVTRNPESDKAQALAQRGVQVVKADQHNQEQVKAALDGSYGAFIVTNFWDPASMGKEALLGASLAQAAAEAKLEHVVFSALADVETESKGKWDVPHFTQKYQAAQKFLEAKVPTTFYAPAFYYQNFGTFFNAQAGEDGVGVFAFPDIGKFWSSDVAQTGEAVLSAFKAPEEWVGKWINMAATEASFEELVADLAAADGKEYKVNTVTLEEYATLFPGAAELAQMFGWFKEFGYFGKTLDVTTGAKAVAHLNTFKEYLANRA